MTGVQTCALPICSNGLVGTGTMAHGGSIPLAAPNVCLVSSVVEQCLDKALAVSSILTRGTKTLPDMRSIIR